MRVYGAEKVRYAVEKDVLAVLESVKIEDLGGRIEFGVASVSFTPARGQDREVDFLLVGRAGIFVLEVKGGEITIKDGIWHSKNHWGQTNKIFPFEQAKHNFYELWKFISLKGVDVERDPTGHFACIFPDYKLRALPDKAWAKEQYLDANFMREPSKHINTLIDYAQKRFNKSGRLDEKVIKQIRTLLVPNYINYIRDMSSAVDDKVLMLSTEQSIVFDSLSDVKRMVIDGPPGSGKTILAVEQLLAKEKEGIKTLYVCFNRAVRNKIAYDVKTRLKHEPKFIDIATTTMVRSKSSKYEFMVLDEAQDYLNDTELNGLNEHLKGGFEQGRFRIFIDLNQDTFHKSELKTLTKLISRDDVLLYPLKHNHRNSAKIIEYVRKMTPLRIGEIRNNPDGPDVEIYKIPYAGISVDYNKYPAYVCEKINELLSSGVQPSEIMIVSISNKYTSALSERNMKNQSLINNVSLVLGRNVDWGRFDKSNTIVNGNAYDLKGLDSKVVICTDVFTQEDNKEALLVGMTRARSRLIVFTGNKIK